MVLLSQERGNERRVIAHHQEAASLAEQLREARHDQIVAGGVQNNEIRLRQWLDGLPKQAILVNGRIEADHAPYIGRSRGQRDLLLLSVYNRLKKAIRAGVGPCVNQHGVAEEAQRRIHSLLCKEGARRIYELWGLQSPTE